MASNPYNNKVQLADGTVLMDLTQDTVTAGKLLSGTTAHDASGAEITGTFLKVGSTWSTDKNEDPASVLGFGTWELIRESPFTWGEMKKHTWGELKQDTWGHAKYKSVIYVWLRTA